MKTAETNVADFDRRIEQAVRWVINATNDDELKAAQKVLNDLRYERNAERFPIVTERGPDGKQKIVFPKELSRKLFNTVEMDIFVKRALAFRAAFIKD